MQMVIEGIKLIFYELIEYNKGTLDNPTKDVIARGSDRLVLELTRRSSGMFTQAMQRSSDPNNHNPARGIRYLLNCLMQVYNSKDLSLQVSDHQCCRFSRNIAYVTLKIICFYY